MPNDLNNAHPVVTALQNDCGRLAMPGSVRHRALLYLHGLIREARRRGHTVCDRPVAAHHRGKINTYGRPDRPDYSRREGELDIVVNGVTATIEITEKHPEATDERFGRLVVITHPAYLSRHRSYRWSDGVRNRIECSVSAVLGELEQRAREVLLEREQQHAAWHEAMQRAREMATQAHYATTLNEQASNWHHARELRDYSEALQQRIHDAQQHSEPIHDAQQWATWAQQYAASIDPLR
jgi:hypothetical protein